MLVFTQSDRVEDYPLLESLLSQTPMVWETRVEGQRVRHDGTVVIGMRAGPAMSASNLCHELCHYIEINVERCNQPGWGLINPPFDYIPGYGEFQRSFNTTAHIDREIRVWAWQSILHRFVGIDEGVESLVRSAVHLPDLELLTDGRLSDLRPDTIRAFFKEQVERVAATYTIEEMKARLEERGAYCETQSRLLAK